MQCKSIASLFSIILFVSLLTGCTSQQSESVSSDSLRIYFTSWPGDYPLILADALGFYEKYNVRVDLIYLESYSNGIVDFINQEIDTMRVILTDALLVAQDEDIQVVWLQDDYLSTIVSTQAIQNPDALRGKRIGVDFDSEIGELVIENVFQIYNIPKEEVTLLDMNVEQVPEALGSQIDAGYTIFPYTSEAVSSGHKILVQVPDVSPNVMIFHTDTVLSRTQDIQSVINAWGDAVLSWEANPTENLSLIAPYYELNPSDLILGIDDGIDTYSQQQNMEAFSPGWSGSLYDTAAVNVNYLVRTGGIRRIPNLEQLINWQFVGRFFQDTD